LDDKWEYLFVYDRLIGVSRIAQNHVLIVFCNFGGEIGGVFCGVIMIFGSNLIKIGIRSFDELCFRIYDPRDDWFWIIFGFYGI